MLDGLGRAQPAPDTDLITRAVGVPALAALAVIHVVDLPGTLGPNRLVGIGYLGIIAVAILAGAAMIARSGWLTWAVVGGVAAAMTGYLLTGPCRGVSSAITPIAGNAGARIRLLGCVLVSWFCCTGSQVRLPTGSSWPGPRQPREQPALAHLPDRAIPAGAALGCRRGADLDRRRTRSRSRADSPILGGDWHRRTARCCPEVLGTGSPVVRREHRGGAAAGRRRPGHASAAHARLIDRGVSIAVGSAPALMRALGQAAGVLGSAGRPSGPAGRSWGWPSTIRSTRSL
jgi:hypothetical protein